MTKMKAGLALAVALLSFLASFKFPGLAGSIVAAGVAGAAYLTTHDDVLATAAKMLGLGSLLLFVGCSPAELQAAKAVAIAEVPVLAQVDAIGKVIANAVGWCEDHGATPATVLEAKQAIADKDLPTAVDVVRKMLVANAAAGVPIPPEVVALVQTAEGAIAADAIQHGMAAVSK